MFSNVDSDIRNLNKHPILQNINPSKTIDDVKSEIPHSDKQSSQAVVVTSTYNTVTPNIELHSPTQKIMGNNEQKQSNINSVNNMSKEQLKEDDTECQSDKEVKTKETASNVLQSSIVGPDMAGGDPLEDEDILKIDRL